MTEDDQDVRDFDLCQTMPEKNKNKGSQKARQNVVFISGHQKNRFQAAEWEFTV
jgi:hypothetical protein